MQKDSIEALYQNRNSLVQEAGLSSLARVFRDPPSKIIDYNYYYVYIYIAHYHSLLNP